MIALVVGSVLAVAALAYVLYPVLFGASEPKAPAERSAGASPDGPLSASTIDDEIEAQVRAYREQKHDRCAACGTPVGARDARYCSNCGNRLPA